MRAGLDIHKMEITVRLCSLEGGDPETEATLESGMRDLVAWPRPWRDLRRDGGETLASVSTCCMRSTSNDHDRRLLAL